MNGVGYNSMVTGEQAHVFDSGLRIRLHQLKRFIGRHIMFSVLDGAEDNWQSGYLVGIDRDRHGNTVLALVDYPSGQASTIVFNRSRQGRNPKLIVLPGQSLLDAKAVRVRKPIEDVRNMGGA